MGKLINIKREFLIRGIFITSFTVILLGIMFLGSIAYLQRISGLDNRFVIGKTDINVEEIFNDAKTQKSDIRLTNTGNTPVYMRAKVLIYYVDDEGNVLGIVPKEGVDYTMEPGTEDWMKKDNIYYYSKPVDPYSTGGVTGETTNLVNCINDLIPDDDKYLVVDVLGQSVQANPISAVKDAWNVTKEDIQ